MTYKVKLNSFEGPFDLLVYLIENAQMSIYDIEISEITSQYLAYIDEMKENNVNVSADFMVLAAELIQIKTRMLLPRHEEELEFLSDEDPRSDLVERLIEYKKFKMVAEDFQERAILQEDIFEKPKEDLSYYLDNPDEQIVVDEEQLIRAFSLFLSKRTRLEEVRKHYTHVARQKQSVEAKVGHIRKLFRKLKKKTMNFKELLVDEKDNYDVVLTFSTLLELIKEKSFDADQKSTYGDIEVIALEGEKNE
ncbi:MAG: segregation/condensation protein A [Clostridia bacterium]|nr:segregation/condensation protein A [Clostridia bacterium]